MTHEHPDRTDPQLAPGAWVRHPGRPDWGLGQVRILKAVSAGGRRHNPDFCISIEGCGDVQGQYANLHLISGLCTRPEVFHYTFPEYILINGLSNTGWKNPTETLGTAFIVPHA